MRFVERLWCRMNEAVRELLLELVAIRPDLSNRGDRHYEAGQLFIRLKEAAQHGQFGRFVRDAGFSARHAQKLIQLARGVDAGAISLKKLSSMTIDEMYRCVRIGKQRDNEAAHSSTSATADAFSTLVFQGDALAYLTAIPSGSVPFIVSDPPYGIGMKYDGWTEPDSPSVYWNWMGPIWVQMLRVLSSPGTIVLWQHQQNLAHLQQWFVGAQIDALFTMTRGERTWTPLVRFQKGKGRVPRHGSWVGPVLGKNDAVNLYGAHPCPKNPRECDAVITHYTTEGALVLDPFCGTGGILVACQSAGRKFTGVDRSAKYVRLAKTHLAQREHC